jgi:DNA-binding CsgD family transcriptional regulator
MISIFFFNLFFLTPRLWEQLKIYIQNSNKPPTYPFADFSFNSFIFIIKWGIPLFFFLFIQRVINQKIKKQLLGSLLLTAIILFAVLLLSWIEPLIFRDSSIIWNLIQVTDLIILAFMFMAPYYLHYRSAFIIDKKLKKALHFLNWIFAGFSLSIFIIIVLLTGRDNNLSSLRYIFSDLCLSLFNLAMILWLTKFAVEFKNQPYGVNTIKTPDIKNFGESFGISKRELEVLELICQGKTNIEIADQLFISTGTVKDHNHSIFKKMNVKTRTQLVRLVLNSIDTKN